jgi:CRP-like cAMP-binding protein
MSNVDVENTLSGLPRALRLQVALTTHKSIFVQLPLFWLCSETEILTIVQRLKPCIVLPGEMLVRQNIVGVGLFILTKGAVEVLQDNALVVVLLAVAAFGEHSLQNARSNVSVRALRFCEVSVLLVDDWAQIESMNRNVSKWLSLYLQERDKKLEDPVIRRQSLQTKTAASKSVSAHAWCNAEDELAQQTYRTRRMLRSSLNATRSTARGLLSMRKKNTTPGRGWLEA